MDPRWLLRTLAGVALAALVCGYATLCLLFYQGQWQLVLHPVRTAARPATIANAGYQVVRFGPDGSGVTQRTGWWIEPGTFLQQGHPLVLLYLPSGDGSLQDAVPKLDEIRRLGVTLLAINYRGYGESAAVHPSEARMMEDAEAAWNYLTTERGVGRDKVVIYGVGVGASLALRMAARHAGTPAVVLDSPRFDVVARMKADPRVRFLPVDLLLRNAFPIQEELRHAHTPKLIFSENAGQTRQSSDAADPKTIITVAHFDRQTFADSLERFLDPFRH